MPKFGCKQETSGGRPQAIETGGFQEMAVVLGPTVMATTLRRDALRELTICEALTVTIMVHNF